VTTQGTDATRPLCSACLEPIDEPLPTPDHVETQHIDPASAVERDDIDSFRVLSSNSSDKAGQPRSNATHTYVNAPTDMSGEPYYYPGRGRSPPRPPHSPIALPFRQEYTDPQIVVAAQNEQDGSEGEPLVITVSPSRHQQSQDIEISPSVHHTNRTPAKNTEKSHDAAAVQNDSTEVIESTVEMDTMQGGFNKPGKQHDVELDLRAVPGELVGVGEHSTFDHADFPQVLDDDLMRDTQ